MDVGDFIVITGAIGDQLISRNKGALFDTFQVIPRLTAFAACEIGVTQTGLDYAIWKSPALFVVSQEELRLAKCADVESAGGQTVEVFELMASGESSPVIGSPSHDPAHFSEYRRAVGLVVLEIEILVLDESFSAAFAVNEGISRAAGNAGNGNAAVTGDIKNKPTGASRALSLIQISLTIINQLNYRSAFAVLDKKVLKTFNANLTDPVERTVSDLLGGVHRHALFC